MINCINSNKKTFLKTLVFEKRIRDIIILNPSDSNPRYLFVDIFCLIAVAALKEGSNNTVVFALIGNSLLLRMSYFFSAVTPSFNTLVLNSSSIVLPIFNVYRMNLYFPYQ